MGRTRRFVPQVWRWACCAESAHHGVGLPFVSSVICFLTGTRPWSLDSERHLWVCHIVHKHMHIGLSASSGWSTQVQLSGPHERASACNEVPLWTRRPPLCPHNFFIPRTSKRAASGPVPRSSHSQLKIHRAIYTAGLNSKCGQLGAKKCFEYSSL